MLDCVLSSTHSLNDAIDALRQRHPTVKLLTRPGVVRLCGFPEMVLSELQALTQSFSEIDALWVPDTLSTDTVKLMAFDMDGTLIENECIDEMGELYGCGDEMANVTRRAMLGELDFAGSLVGRVSLLKGAPYSVVDEAVQRMRFFPGAHDLAKFAERHGLHTYIFSGGFPEFTNRAVDILGFEGSVSNELVYDKHGHLTGEVVGPAGGKLFDADGKRRALEVVTRLHGLTLEQTLTAGDGANDVQMLSAAGFSVAFRAKPTAQKAASCAIRWGGLDLIPLLFREGWR